MTALNQSAKKAAAGILRPSDIALLQAALLDDEEAKQAFRSWRKMTDFEGNHDLGQFRMLPLLHSNMSRLKMDDPVMPRLRGVHRYSWCEARRREFLAVQAISTLQKNDIKCMALKGLALSQDYYQDAALRPMQDIDLLIPIVSVVNAVNCLVQTGWEHKKPAVNGSTAELRKLLAIEKDILLKHPDGGEIELHWYPFLEGARKRVSDRFWNNAVEMVVGGVKLLRPCAADLLLHVVVHGIRDNPVAPLRWVADAAMIIRRDGDAIDWNELDDFAASLKIRSRLYSGLDLMAEFLAIDIPVAARSAVPTAIERFEGYAYDWTSCFPASARTYWLRAGLRFGRIWYSDNRQCLFSLFFDWVFRRSSILLLRLLHAKKPTPP